MVKSRFHRKLNLIKTPTQKKKLIRPRARIRPKEMYARMAFQARFGTINFHFRDENSINYPNSAQSWHCTTNWLDVCITQRNKRLNQLYNKHNIFRGASSIYHHKDTPLFATTCFLRGLFCTPLFAHPRRPCLFGTQWLE
ncbi:hypothetical protein CEXT_183961 [Caerostris extrusa]|uniref:Uncharacterized protein n=1 Tax=Caerostris extrusa TaxID=172846 RepID=A0AAV4XQA0_CAEEX|nr:hypothetical protein CEXT_183961 [Caerostris extrusa]